MTFSDLGQNCSFLQWLYTSPDGQKNWTTFQIFIAPPAITQFLTFDMVDFQINYSVWWKFDFCPFFARWKFCPWQ